MYLTVTKATRKLLNDEQNTQLTSVLEIMNDMARAGQIVVKDLPADRKGKPVDVGPDTEYIDQPAVALDNEGRDRSLRMGGVAQNERNYGPPQPGNQPPDSGGDFRTADRMDRLESLMGNMLAAVKGELFPGAMNARTGIISSPEWPSPRTTNTAAPLRNGMGSQQPRDFDERDLPLGGRTPWGIDDDGNPDFERPFDTEGHPTDQSRDRHSLRTQDEVYAKPQNRDVRRSLPVQISPADDRREWLLREIQKELSPGGRYLAGGAPMESQDVHHSMKGLFGVLFGDPR